MDPKVVFIIQSDITLAVASKEALGTGWISWMVVTKAENFFPLALGKNKSTYKQEKKTNTK